MVSFFDVKFHLFGFARGSVGGFGELMLSPDRVNEDTYSIETLSLEPGNYRIVKTFSVPNGEANASLAAPFEVVP